MSHRYHHMIKRKGEKTNSLQNDKTHEKEQVNHMKIGH